MKLLFTIVVLMVIAISCKKDYPSTLTVDVYDYITSQPIQGATVKRAFSTGFDLSCLCYQANGADSLGRTDSNGQLKGLLSLDFIFVEKNGYYSAQEHYYSIHEKTDYFLKLSMFRQAAIRLTSNPVISYHPEPYVEAGPLLRNGSMKSLISDGDRLPAIQGYVLNRPAAGDMQNRILILKRNDVTSRIDTLYKTDVFIPANTTLNLNVSY